MNTLLNSFQGPIATVGMSADGTSTKYIETTKVDDKIVTTFLSKFQLKPGPGNISAIPTGDRGFNALFNLKLNQAQLDQLYKIALTPMTADVVVTINQDPSKQNKDPNTIKLTLTTLSQSLCNNTDKIVDQYVFTFSGDAVTSDIQTVYFVYTDPIVSCTPKVFSAKVQARLLQSQSIRNFYLFTQNGQDGQQFCNNAENRAKCPLAGSTNIQPISPTLFLFDILEQDQSPINWTLSYKSFLEQTFSFPFTNDYVQTYKIPSDPELPCTVCIPLEDALKSDVIHNNTIGALYVKFIQRGTTFVNENPLFLLGGTFPSTNKTDNDAFLIKNQEIVQIRAVSTARDRFLCYTDRGKFNTPWMAGGKGEYTNASNTYWKIYALENDGSVSCDPNRILKTDSRVAFQSLECQGTDKCFPCSFISSQKQGGRAPSMEGKFKPDVCEQWSIRSVPPLDTKTVVRYEDVVWISSSGQPDTTCKEAGKRLKVNCDVNNQDVCLTSDKPTNSNQTEFQWQMIRVDPIQYTPVNKCSCPP